MLRVRDGSASTATRGLRLGRRGKKTSVFSVSDLMKPEQLVFISSSPSTKDVSPITTSKLTNSQFWACLEDVRTNIMKTYFKASPNCTKLLVRP